MSSAIIIFNIGIASAIFLLTLFITLMIIYYRKSEKVQKQTSEPFMGGEKVSYDEFEIPPESTFYTIKKSFQSFYEKIGKKHTGIISDYLAWILLVLIILLIILISRGVIW